MLISFRPTKKVISYLKPLKNKSKEINDILEMYISGDTKVKANDLNILKPETTSFYEQIQEQVRERESPLFDYIEPVEEIVKDKKYYENLNKYTTIKNMGGCFSANGERMDTQEALQYANLLSFTP